MDCAVRAIYESDTIYYYNSARMQKCSLPYKTEFFENDENRWRL